MFWEEKPPVAIEVVATAKCVKYSYNIGKVSWKPFLCVGGSPKSQVFERRNDTVMKEGEETKRECCWKIHGIQASRSCYSWLVFNICSAATSNTVQRGERPEYGSPSSTCGGQGDLEDCFSPDFWCNENCIQRIQCRLSVVVWIALDGYRDSMVRTWTLSFLPLLTMRRQSSKRGLWTRIIHGGRYQRAPLTFLGGLAMGPMDTYIVLCSSLLDFIRRCWVETNKCQGKGQLKLTMVLFTDQCSRTVRNRCSTRGLLEINQVLRDWKRLVRSGLMSLWYTSRKVVNCMMTCGRVLTPKPQGAYFGPYSMDQRDEQHS